MYSQIIAGFTMVGIVALCPRVLAFIAPCVYQGYTCGYNMIDRFGKPSRPFCRWYIPNPDRRL